MEQNAVSYLSLVNASLQSNGSSYFIFRVFSSSGIIEDKGIPIIRKP